MGKKLRISFKILFFLLFFIKNIRMKFIYSGRASKPSCFLPFFVHKLLQQILAQGIVGIRIYSLRRLAFRLFLFQILGRMQESQAHLELVL